MLAVYLGAALALVMLTLPMFLRSRRSRRSVATLDDVGPRYVRLRPYTPIRRH